MKHAPEKLMSLALEEAFKVSRFSTYPNPRVGAALETTKGEVVSAAHQISGAPHAEVLVLEEAKRKGLNVEGAQLAVTLEPCSHFGKTPPCVDQLIKEGISKVFVGGKDPFGEVNGRGFEKLRQSGIEIVEPIMGSECYALNREWLTAESQGYPFVRIKLATSLDGLWAAENGESQWITSEQARQMANAMRADAEVLITGAGTIRVDNPRLTVRNTKGTLEPRQPKVHVLSCHDKSFDLSPYKVSTHPGGAVSHFLEETQLSSYLQDLLKVQRIHEVFVEAGPTLTHRFLNQKLFNEVHLFQASKFLGGSGLRLGAFNQGKLPGLDLEIFKIELVDATDYRVILIPRS